MKGKKGMRTLPLGIQNHKMFNSICYSEFSSTGLK